MFDEDYFEYENYERIEFYSVCGRIRGVFDAIKDAEKININQLDLLN